jgi:drug/metabolite transporter (DMT)-like permease
VTRTRIDLVAVAAAVLAVAMAVVYVRLMDAQGDRPLWWVLAVLLVGAGGAVYGSIATGVRRTTALIGAGVLLFLLGVLAILSIGLPILLAGALSLLAALRSRPA